jgi:hypothetical protein
MKTNRSSALAIALAGLCVTSAPQTGSAGEAVARSEQIKQLETIIRETVKNSGPYGQEQPVKLGWANTAIVDDRGDKVCIIVYTVESKNPVSPHRPHVENGPLLACVAKSALAKTAPEPPGAN